MEEPAPGVYYHFKHPEHRYTVLGIALHTETEEQMVVYRRHHDQELFVRPLAMFLEEVDKPEYGYTGPRFVYVGPA
jgi:hypothetical protein